MPKEGRKKHVQVTVTMTEETKSLYRKVCNHESDEYFNYEVFGMMLRDYAEKKNIPLED